MAEVAPGKYWLAATRPGVGRPSVVLERDEKGELRLLWLRVTASVDTESQEVESDNVETRAAVRMVTVSPDTYFMTSRLLKMPIADKHTVLANREGYVPPLQPEILDFFEPNDLDDLLSWSRKRSSVVASLRLPVESQDGRRLMAFFSRVYRSDDIKVLEPSPVMEIWPDFRARSWRHYYGICQTPGDSSVRFVPYPAAFLRVDVGQHSTKWKMEQMPDAMQCTVNHEPAGLILIRQPRELGPATQEWNLTFDISSPRMSLFYRRRSEQPKSLPLDDRCVQLTSVPPFVRAVFLRDGFFPGVGVSGSFDAKVRMLNGTPPLSAEPVFDSLVLLDPEETTPSSEHSGPALGLGDAAWKGRDTSACHFTPFLRQMLLMVAAEARACRARDVNVQLSFPLSAGGDAVAAVTEVAEGTIESIGDPELKLVLGDPESDSTAVCKYLCEVCWATPAAISRPQIVLSVAENGTNMDFWIDRRLAVHCPVFLGSGLLLEHATEDGAFRTALASIARLSSSPHKPEDSRRSAIRELLRSYADRVGRDWRSAELTRAGAEPLVRARQIVFMTLGGLVWFGGRLLQQACRTCPGIDSCDIYFTDDGARLLPWLGNPAVARDSLKTMFRQAAAPTAVLGDVGIAVARHPGEEVVRGLSASYSPDPGCPTAFLPLGERDCYLDGRPSPWHLNIVRPDALNDVSKVELPNGMPELRDFIEAFNIQAAKLEVAALSESLASRRCAQEFLKALVPVATERSPQPLFIEELDYVIRQLLAVNPERAAQPSDEAATTQEDAKAVWRFE